MQYPERFFEISWQFAAKTASVSHRPLADALLDHTNFYIRFGLGRDFDPVNAIWQDYVCGLDRTTNPIEWTYQFYLQHGSRNSDRSDEPTFGYFSYSVLPQQKIRLHFHNSDPIDRSPLSTQPMPTRRAELVAMFSHIRQNVIEPTAVVGGSWLYNFEAYRRLFPSEYLASAHLAKGEFAFLTLWGQFINRFGQVKEILAAPFLAHLNQATAIDQLEDCFPYQVIHVECSIQHFYDCYPT